MKNKIVIATALVVIFALLSISVAVSLNGSTEKLSSNSNEETFALSSALIGKERILEESLLKKAKALGGDETGEQPKGMLTYTSVEHGFSIEYPEDWTVEEGMGYVVSFTRFDGTNANVVTEELPTRMTADELAEATREYLEGVGYKTIKTFTDTINGEPVACYVLTISIFGVELKQMQACFVIDTTGYAITFSADSNTYDEAYDDYFEHMLQSFRFMRILVENSTEVLEGENFTATVNADNVSDLAILVFKLSYDSSVIELKEVEKGSDISNWSRWDSLRNPGAGIVKVFAFSDPSGAPINGSAELVKLEFKVVGDAGNKSVLDIQGILGNSDVESIRAIWMDSEVTISRI
jgi:hypothetical protein